MPLSRVAGLRALLTELRACRLKMPGRSLPGKAVWRMTDRPAKRKSPGSQNAKSGLLPRILP